MSRRLYVWGRWAARRAWAVIGAWFVVSVAGGVGFRGVRRAARGLLPVPGLDSQQAVELQTAGDAEAAGLTAQFVLTPA